MTKPKRWNPIAVALYANAALLFGILAVLLGRGQSGFPAAFGASSQQPPITGGNGLYIMPCQVHANVWGCYLLDTEHQTLCVYEYQAGNRDLTLTAARLLQYDVALKNYNTSLPYYAVQKLVADEANNQRDRESRQSPPAADVPKPQ